MRASTGGLGTRGMGGMGDMGVGGRTDICNTGIVNTANMVEPRGGRLAGRTRSLEGRGRAETARASLVTSGLSRTKTKSNRMSQSQP
jgi:hypothetical protein